MSKKNTDEAKPWGLPSVSDAFPARRENASSIFLGALIIFLLFVGILAGSGLAVTTTALKSYKENYGPYVPPEYSVGEKYTTQEEADTANPKIVSLSENIPTPAKTLGFYNFFIESAMDNNGFKIAANSTDTNKAYIGSSSATKSCKVNFITTALASGEGETDKQATDKAVASYLAANPTLVAKADKTAARVQLFEPKLKSLDVEKINLTGKDASGVDTAGYILARSSVTAKTTFMLVYTCEPKQLTEVNDYAVSHAFTLKDQ